MDTATRQRLEEQVREHGLTPEPALIDAVLAPIVAQTADSDSVALGDLYLAVACSHGDGAALRRFETLYGPTFDRAIRRSPKLRVNPDEFRQLVLDRLFVAPQGSAPRIAQYQGRGSLEGWLRVMTTRLVIDLSRARKRPEAVGDETLVERMSDGQNTEVAVLRHAYGPALEQAFSRGLAALEVRQRNLLRQRYLHDVSGDALAKLYGIHRATMFGWLDKARTALLFEVRQALAAAVPGDQLESVVGMLGSELHVSVRRLLDSQLETEA
ncbi:MAG: hypothetical protein ACRBN8_09775 [Nannocystales bacterium]